MTNLEISIALAQNAKLVLSFTTQIKCRNPKDPLRSLITSRAPPPMSFTAFIVHIAKSYTLVKQGDDLVTDSENTFATQKEMTRTYPNQSQGTLISLIILDSIWQFAVFPYARQYGKPQNSKTKLQIGTLNPNGNNERFTFN